MAFLHCAQLRTWEKRSHRLAARCLRRMRNANSRMASTKRGHSRRRGGCICRAEPPWRPFGKCQRQALPALVYHRRAQGRRGGARGASPDSRQTSIAFTSGRPGALPDEAVLQTIRELILPSAWRGKLARFVPVTPRTSALGERVSRCRMGRQLRHTRTLRLWICSVPRTSRERVKF